MSKVNYARLYVVAAALLWSSSGFFVKADVFIDWPATEQGPVQAFWRSVFAGLCLIPFIRKPCWDLRLIPMVLAFAGMNFTFLSSMAIGNAADAIWLQYMAPVWVFIVGIRFFQEQKHPRDTWMLVMTLVGLGIILSTGLQSRNPLAITYGVLASFFFASVILLMRSLRAIETVWLVALNHGVTVLLFLPYVQQSTITPNTTQYLYLIAFGIFQIGLPYLLFAASLRWISGHEASSISLLEPLLVPLWTYLAWGEITPTSTLLGGTFILIGLGYRYLGASRAANDTMRAERNEAPAAP